MKLSKSWHNKTRKIKIKNDFALEIGSPLHGSTGMLITSYFFPKFLTKIVGVLCTQGYLIRKGLLFTGKYGS